MTREDAIASIKTLCNTCESFPKCVNEKPECFQAIEMAIKALEQEPCEDAVSREAVIETVIDWITSDEFRWSNAIYYMKKRLNNLPSVTPKPRTGEWIDDNCSECGFYVYHGDMRNFCPKCGAKMNGGGTNEPTE